MRSGTAGLVAVCALVSAGSVAGAAECRSAKECILECAAGKAVSCDFAGKRFFSGVGVIADASMAQKLFAIGCNAGAANACVNLGMAYREGYAVRRDEARAGELFEMGCVAGSARGCTLLGQFCDQRSADGDAHRSQVAFERACDGGDQEGCTLLAEKLVVRLDVPRGVALLEKVCRSKGGFARACLSLADLYEGSDAVPASATRARALRDRACKLGDEPACLRLASKDQEDERYDSARKIYERLCSHNSGQGCYQLGLLYGDGLGVAEDDKRAAELMARACDFGSSEGCSMAQDE